MTHPTPLWLAAAVAGPAIPGGPVRPRPLGRPDMLPRTASMAPGRQVWLAPAGRPTLWSAAATTPLWLAAAGAGGAARPCGTTHNRASHPRPAGPRAGADSPEIESGVVATALQRAAWARPCIPAPRSPCLLPPLPLRYVPSSGLLAVFRDGALRESRVIVHGTRPAPGAMLPSAEACLLSAPQSGRAADRAGRIVEKQHGRPSLKLTCVGPPAGDSSGFDLSARRPGPFGRVAPLGPPDYRRPGPGTPSPPLRAAQKGADEVASPLTTLGAAEEGTQ